MSQAKPADKLTPKDWEKYPVWTFDSANEGRLGRDETWMVPVKKLPSTNIMNGGCRAEARFACGQPMTVVLWGVDLNPGKTLRMLSQYTPMTVEARTEYLKPNTPTFTIFVKGRWWHSDLNGPSDLTESLGLTIQEIFPIDYDISAFAAGVKRAVRGKIPSPFQAYENRRWA